MGMAPSWSSGRYILATVLGVWGTVGPSATRAEDDQATLVSTFRTLEQRLMDAIAPGDKPVWDSVMDDACLVTSEEGQLSSKADFLRELEPLVWTRVTRRTP